MSRTDKPNINFGADEGTTLTPVDYVHILYCGSVLPQRLRESEGHSPMVIESPK